MKSIASLGSSPGPKVVRISTTASTCESKPSRRKTMTRNHNARRSLATRMKSSRDRFYNSKSIINVEWTSSRDVYDFA